MRMDACDRYGIVTTATTMEEAVWLALKLNQACRAQLMAEWQNAASQYQRISKQPGKNNDPRMTEFRWMLEELRVSLFAQELRTPMPVSAKRLQKVWESMIR